MEPRFVSSTKNKPILVLHNFKYTHYNKNNRQISHWRCVQYHKGCRAQIKTCNNKIVNNANPIHNHGHASSATASRPRMDSTTTSKAKTNLDQKIAMLQKLLSAKSSKNSSKKDESDSGEHSSIEDESDSGEHSSIEDDSDSGEHSSIEDDSDSNKHSSNKDKSISSKHTTSKKEKDRPHKIFNKNKKPMKWVK